MEPSWSSIPQTLCWKTVIPCSLSLRRKQTWPRDQSQPAATTMMYTNIVTSSERTLRSEDVSCSHHQCHHQCHVSVMSVTGCTCMSSCVRLWEPCDSPHFVLAGTSHRFSSHILWLNDWILLVCFLVNLFRWCGWNKRDMRTKWKTNVWFYITWSHIEWTAPHVTVFFSDSLNWYICLILEKAFPEE